MNQSKSKKSIVILGIFALVVVIMFGIYIITKPEGTKGSKEIVVEVVIPNEDSKEFTLHTDAEFLRQALDEENLVKGIDDPTTGLFITEVNGRAADDSKREWWAVTKDGIMTETGVDSIAIMDGDHYELTLSNY